MALDTCTTFTCRVGEGRDERGREMGGGGGGGVRRRERTVRVGRERGRDGSGRREICEGGRR